MGLMNFLTAIIIAASNSVFSPSEHFIANLCDDNVKVRIMYVNTSFSDNFLNFNEGPERRHSIRKYSTGERLYYVDIIGEFGNSYIESSLFDIWTLLSLQPRGQEGDLSISKDNIFFAKDAKGVMWAILVKWSVSGWYIGAFSLDRGDIVEKGSLVFIRRN